MVDLVALPASLPFPPAQMALCAVCSRHQQSIPGLPICLPTHTACDEGCRQNEVQGRSTPSRFVMIHNADPETCCQPAEQDRLHCIESASGRDIGCQPQPLCAYLCRLVLRCNHPGRSHQRPLYACGWLVLTQQVKAMQPPVQRLCYHNSSHADVPMYLHRRPSWSAHYASSTQPGHMLKTPLVARSWCIIALLAKKKKNSIAPACSHCSGSLEPWRHGTAPWQCNPPCNTS